MARCLEESQLGLMLELKPSPMPSEAPPLLLLALPALAMLPALPAMLTLLALQWPCSVAGSHSLLAG